MSLFCSTYYKVPDADRAQLCKQFDEALRRAIEHVKDEWPKSTVWPVASFRPPDEFEQQHARRSSLAAAAIRISSVRESAGWIVFGSGRQPSGSTFEAQGAQPRVDLTERILLPLVGSALAEHLGFFHELAYASRAEAVH